MELKGSRTEQNLMTAFSGESQARNKYTFYAAKARQDGYEQIANIFEETANNEKEHAEIWMTYLRGGMPDTVDALEDAAGGEHYEWSEMYAEFAAVAKEEGFTEIAAVMERVASIEQNHEERYRQLVANIKEGKVFSREKETVWICLNCGYEVVGEMPPAVCPTCRKPQAYFQMKVKDY